MEQIELQKTRSIKLDYSEALYSAIKRYANEKGITEEQAFIQLTNDALKLSSLMNGVVTEISSEVKEQLMSISLTAMQQYDAQKQTPTTNAAEADTNSEAEPVKEPETVEIDNEIVFDATPQVIELIQEINKTRALKGLAPLQNSLTELLHHWGKNLAENDVFTETTGLDHEWFSRNTKEMGLAEREANEAKSNLLEKSGGFLYQNYTIVDTAA